MKNYATAPSTYYASRDPGASPYPNAAPRHSFGEKLADRVLAALITLSVAAIVLVLLTM